MDLLIKNMEMPKSCGECKLAVNAYGSLTEGKCAVLGYGVTYLSRRCDACPLVEADDMQETIMKLKEELQIASYKLTDRVVTEDLLLDRARFKDGSTIKMRPSDWR